MLLPTICELFALELPSNSSHVLIVNENFNEAQGPTDARMSTDTARDMRRTTHPNFAFFLRMVPVACEKNRVATASCLKYLSLS
jgi:hypothetical protein